MFNSNERFIVIAGVNDDSTPESDGNVWTETTEEFLDMAVQDFRDRCFADEEILIIHIGPLTPIRALPQRTTI